MPHVHFAPDTSLYDTIMATAVHQPNGQTLFSCPWHGPATGMTSTAPNNSCQGCWILYFLRLEAVTPPEEREQLFYNLNKHMTEAVKLAESGKWDLELDRHPTTSVVLDPDDFKATPTGVKE